LTSKKLVLFGAGKFGRKALSFFGVDKVYCFADNQKAGQGFLDKKVISFDELLVVRDDYEIVLSVGYTLTPILMEQCDNAGVDYSLFEDWLTLENCESDPMIRKFHNIHRNERCFLIGNGPSLLPDDLTKLHERGEICFGCNEISKIFSETPWRPDYFCVTDHILINLRYQMLADTDAKNKFFPKLGMMDVEDIATIMSVLKQGKGQTNFFTYFVMNNKVRFGEESLLFSNDASKVIYGCATVMYMMIQLSVYMGFNEIYLLGVDGGTTSMADQKEYLLEKRHFYENDKVWVQVNNEDFSQPSSNIYQVSLDKAYSTYEDFTRANGISILNATRGGSVKAFRKACFDTLLKP